MLTFVNQDERFKIVSNQKVESMELYDILGRLLIQVVPNSKAFYLNNTSIKKGTVVIVKANLENGKIINKKVIKY